MNNTRFTFANTNQELWTDLTTLIDISPRFKKLFPATITQQGGQKVTFDSAEHKDGRVFVDYEGEEDKVGKEKEVVGKGKGKEVNHGHPMPEASSNKKKRKTSQSTSASLSSPTPSPPSPTQPFLTVIDKSGNYTTCRALLTWVESREISYRPLDADPNATFNAPLSPSAKSILRLASYLEIPDLVESSLAALEKTLTVENVARELFGDMSIAFPNLQKLELDFVLANWNAAKESAGWKTVEKQMEKGEGTPGMGAVLMKVMKELTRS